VGSELLSVSSVSKRFGDVEAVRGVDMGVEPGEFVAIVGRSGSGKTTLLNLLSGLETPDKGSISYQGEELDGASEDELAMWRRRHVGLVFQAYHLITTLSALENVAVPLYPEPIPTHERATLARSRLEQVGLGHRMSHRPSQLSGGEQQRVAIARALVNDPELVLADEPTGNLDAATGEEILDLFGRVRREHDIAVVVVTHDEKVAASADRVIRITDGRVMP
jgi:putative ABC transport system ATP-binding protein